MSNEMRTERIFEAMRNTEPYLADDGFTAGVIAKLPEPKELPAWIKNLIMLTFTATASAIVAWLLPVNELVAFAVNDMFSLTSLTVAAVSAFVFSYVVIWLEQANLTS